jgi:hypothetical protein
MACFEKLSKGLGDLRVQAVSWQQNPLQIKVRIKKITPWDLAHLKEEWSREFGQCTVKTQTKTGQSPTVTLTCPAF